LLRSLPSLGSRDCGGGRYLPRLSLIGKGLLAGGTAFYMQMVCMAQSAAAVSEPNVFSGRDILDQILAFIYSLGHLIGEGIVRLVTAILPSLEFPTDLVDPIGLLAILTIFLAVATIAKKLVWIVLIAGWVLILVRLILVIVQTYF